MKQSLKLRGKILYYVHLYDIIIIKLYSRDLQYGAGLSSDDLPSYIDSSRAVEALKYELKALTSLLQSNLGPVSCSLQEKSIISESDEQEAINKTVISKTRASNLLKVVKDKIESEPHVFTEFVEALELIPSLKAQANKLVQSYKGIILRVQLQSRVYLFIWRGGLESDFAPSLQVALKLM